ncbi:MAG: hypothetical protein ACFB4I_17430 [Cyanophyceae cyanobacterium]
MTNAHRRQGHGAGEVRLVSFRSAVKRRSIRGLNLLGQHLSLCCSSILPPLLLPLYRNFGDV